MMKTIKRLLFTASALAFIFVAQTASASAESIHPMTFDICGTTSSDYNCMYIEGSGDSAIEVRGWSNPGSTYDGVDFHEQVIEPDKSTYCNSSTADVTGSGTIVGCQGGDENIPTGQWCAISWGYIYGPTGVPGTNGYEYRIVAENCGTVSV